jgi:fucose permease
VWNLLPRHLIAQGISEASALNILSFGFAIGMLIGRVAILPVLAHVPAITVTLAGSIAMAVTTFFMLRTSRPVVAGIWVLLAGISMGPVFPTAIAIVGDAFPHLSGTAIGFVITCGWIGLAVTSHIIGAIAGGDPRRLKTALLVIPGSAIIMVGLDLAIRSVLH